MAKSKILLFLGNENSGKTELANQLSRKINPEKAIKEPPRGEGDIIRVLEAGSFTIFDAPESQRFSFTISPYISMASVVCVVINTDQKKEDFSNFLKECKKCSKVPIILVNKANNTLGNEIYSKIQSIWGADNEVPIFFCSLETGLGLEEAFQAIISRANALEDAEALKKPQEHNAPSIASQTREWLALEKWAFMIWMFGNFVLLAALIAIYLPFFDWEFARIAWIGPAIAWNVGVGALVWVLAPEDKAPSSHSEDKAPMYTEDKAPMDSEDKASGLFFTTSSDGLPIDFKDEKESKDKQSLTLVINTDTHENPERVLRTP